MYYLLQSNLLLPFEYTVPTVEALHIISLTLFLYALAMPGQKSIDVTEKRLLIFVGVICSFMALLDLLIQFGWLSPVGLPRFLPVSFFTALLFVQTMWFIKFQQTYRDAQRTNSMLKMLVKEKEKELSNQFRKLAKIETEKARISERQQIFREIHDGMGGHLVSAIALTERESPDSAALTAIRSAHDDMRLLLEGGSLSDANLGEAMGQLRYQLEPQISAAGLSLIWKMPTDLELPDMDFQQHMHVARVMQESVTNVVKHANATTVTIALQKLEDNIEIAVIDNGKGESDITPGNGLKNLQYRASQLGGIYSFTPGKNGSIAKLILDAELALAI